MRRGVVASVCALLGLLGSCAGASNDPGLSAQLFVSDAQFVRGALPEGARESPTVESFLAPHAEVQPGARKEQLHGAMSADATALALGLAGDEGYWILTAGVPTLEEPDLPTFAATVSFARALRGELTLLARAVDAHGHFGPERSLTLEVAPGEARGPLVVTLRWEDAADLDLHVLVPGGEEIWAGNLNSVKAPAVGAPPADPAAFTRGAILDFDANADCAQDGRREENVLWHAEPSAGRYEVRVAAASLCGESASHFSVEAWLHGKRVGLARGTSLPSDTWQGARRGAGVAALTFDVP